MKLCNRYIQFEFQTRVHPFGSAVGIDNGGEAPIGDSESVSSRGDGSYHTITEDDLQLLARALGGA